MVSDRAMLLLYVVLVRSGMQCAVRPIVASICILLYVRFSALIGADKEKEVVARHGHPVGVSCATFLWLDSFDRSVMAFLPCLSSWTPTQLWRPY